MSDPVLTHDLHHLTVEPPVHREAGRRWVVLLAALGSLAVVDAPLPARLFVAVLLVGMAVIRGEVRRTRIHLEHDALVLEVPRFGHPHVERAPWNQVAFARSEEAPWVLFVQMRGEPPRQIPWDGPVSGLDAVLDTLAAARSAYRPDAAVVEPEPLALARLRGHRTEYD